MNHSAEPAPRAETTAPHLARRARRAFWRSLRSWRPWRRNVAALTTAALLVAACGGSTEQYDPFVPQRLISFGDEASALGDGTSAPLGANWSVNGRDADGNFACNLSPIWIQGLASIYGFVFAECNLANVAAPQARTWAVAGAKVADVAAQIAAQEQAGGFNEKDIVTYLVGTNDVLELYRQSPQRSDDDLIAEATERGRAAGRQVNQIVRAGAKVVLAEVPDLSFSPFAVHEGADRAQLIFKLVAAFNIGLETTIILDGRYIGLVQIFQRTQAIGRGTYGGFVNVTGAVCAVAPPACYTDTLVDGGSSTTWLWAYDLWLSYGGHRELASMAIDRATRNPF